MYSNSTPLLWARFSTAEACAISSVWNCVSCRTAKLIIFLKSVSVKIIWDSRPWKYSCNFSGRERSATHIYTTLQQKLLQMWKLMELNIRAIIFPSLLTPTSVRHSQLPAETGAPVSSQATRPSTQVYLHRLCCRYAVPPKRSPSDVTGC